MKVGLASPCQHQVLRIPSKGKLTPFHSRYRKTIIRSEPDARAFFDFSEEVACPIREAQDDISRLSARATMGRMPVAAQQAPAASWCVSSIPRKPRWSYNRLQLRPIFIRAGDASPHQPRLSPKPSSRLAGISVTVRKLARARTSRVPRTHFADTGKRRRTSSNQFTNIVTCRFTLAPFDPSSSANAMMRLPSGVKSKDR